MVLDSRSEAKDTWAPGLILRFLLTISMNMILLLINGPGKQTSLVCDIRVRHLLLMVMLMLDWAEITTAKIWVIFTSMIHPPTNGQPLQLFLEGPENPQRV